MEQHLIFKHTIYGTILDSLNCLKTPNFKAFTGMDFVLAVYAALGVLTVLSFIVPFMLHSAGSMLTISKTNACLLSMTLIVGIVYGVQYYKAYKECEEKDI